MKLGMQMATNRPIRETTIMISTSVQPERTVVDVR